jgi:phage gp36-like protein
MKIELKGNTYQKTSILPEEYTQVDYIQNSAALDSTESNKSYIDTGVIPYLGVGFKAEIEFAPTILSHRYCLISNYIVGTSHISCELKATNEFRLYLNTGALDKSSTETATTDKNKVIVERDDNNNWTMSVNGVLTTNAYSYQTDTKNPLLLFVDTAKRFSTFAYPLKIYKCKI